MSICSSFGTWWSRVGLTSAFVLVAALLGAADAPGGGFGSGGDAGYKPVETSSPTPLPEAGLKTREELEAFVDGFVSAELEAYNVAGLTVAVVKDGQIFFAKGYGYADVKSRAPVVADETLFRPGSVSKLLTWTAVMQLVEQGKLDLDADVNTYLTQLKIPATYEAPITLRHVLTHTVGLEDGGIGYLMARSPSELVPLEHSLAAHQPSRVRPVGASHAGLSSSYSNWATALAGLIVANVSGQTSKTTSKPASCGPSACRAARSTSRCPRPSRSACRWATPSRAGRSSRTATSTFATSARRGRWRPRPPTWPAS